MRVAAWVLTAMSVVFWSLAGAATWAGVDLRALAIEVGASCATTVLAGVCWIAFGVRDRDKDALVRAMAQVTIRRGQAETRPHSLRRVS